MENILRNHIEEYVAEQKLDITDEQIGMLQKYASMLVEWNQKINLTAIKDPSEIAIKHFIDSLTCLKLMVGKAKPRVIDIGTGAGFPGLVIKIMRMDAEVYLVDSVGKKLDFVQAVIEELKLKDVYTQKARAEELARMKEYRETFDFAVTRGVSSMPVVLEYCTPLLSVGGICLAMKGPKVIEEIESAKKAANILGAEITAIESYNLPRDMGIRKIVVAQKKKNTSSIYPRNTGMPEKKPLS